MRHGCLSCEVDSVNQPSQIGDSNCNKYVRRDRTFFHRSGSLMLHRLLRTGERRSPVFSVCSASPMQLVRVAFTYVFAPFFFRSYVTAA
jgi:hypothetical protein